MQMTELIKYDIPEQVVAMWAQEESASLLPLQETVVKRHGLFSGGNLLIQAPTSSGKTFIGEMAALQTALRQKKVVYLAPLKALAEEKYRRFKAKYEDYGLKVIVCSRDHRDFDGDLEAGHFSIAVVVYEKLAQLLVRRPERLAEIELIVADELEILSDPERGAMAELLLTRVLQEGRRLIGLSAVIGGAERLAEWMGGTLVRYERRPVELRYGVLHEGCFRYRTYNDQSTGTEELAWSGVDSVWETLTENVCAFAAAGEPCLIFVKAKHESRRGAELLAERVSAPPAEDARATLGALDGTRARDMLLETLSTGVAFHNADLSPAERRVVEEGFRRGEIRVLVSTSTLAVGLNLPARNVFISAEKWRYDQRLDMPWKTPIQRTEYENMSGRAGRYGAGFAFGRAILVAASAFDADTYWRRYVEGERETVTPRLAREPLEDHLIRLVASRFCATAGELAAFLEETLSGKWVWREQYTAEEVELRIRAALTRCIEAGVIVEEDDGRLRAAPLGQAIAAKGIGLATAQAFEAWLGASARRYWLPVDPLFMAASTLDGRMLQIMLTAREYDEGDYPGQLRACTRDMPLEGDVPVNRIRQSTMQPFFEEVRAVKAALLLDGWINQRPVRALEDEYNTMAGQILSAAEQAAWLMDALAAVGVAVGAPQALVKAVEILAGRLQWGVSERVLPLAACQLPGLDRNALIALDDSGLLAPGALADRAEADLARAVPPESIPALLRWATEESDMPREKFGTDEAASAAPRPVLVIDAAKPGEILVDGAPVRLQDKQFRLICCLAARPDACVPYETIYAEVWGDVIVEDNQMHFQKRKLLKAIAAAAPSRAELVKTVPKRGFCLALPSEALVYRRAASAAA